MRIVIESDDSSEQVSRQRTTAVAAAEISAVDAGEPRAFGVQSSAENVAAPSVTSGDAGGPPEYLLQLLGDRPQSDQPSLLGGQSHDGGSAPAIT